MCASTPSQSQHALNIRTHLSKITPLLSDRKQLLETADKIYRYLAEEKISIELMKNKESRVLIPSLDQMIRIISESENKKTDEAMRKCLKLAKELRTQILNRELCVIC